MKAASSQPASDSEHKTCSLPVGGFGAVPRILPGSCSSQIPLRQQENPVTVAQKILPKHKTEVSGQPPHLSPMSSLTQLSLLLVPAHKETEMSPGAYAIMLQKYKTVKCESFTQLPPFNHRFSLLLFCMATNSNFLLKLENSLT